MKNGQLKPGCNLQIAVEGEYIVGTDISSYRSDMLTLIPFLKKLEEENILRLMNIVTDSGYESEENYEYLAEHELNAYIKPSSYEQSKKRKSADQSIPPHPHFIILRILLGNIKKTLKHFL